MTKRILICCGAPHCVEFMEPTIREAQKRGHQIYGAFAIEEHDAVKKVLSWAGIAWLTSYGGWWKHYTTGPNDPGILEIPEADLIFRTIKPDAMIIDIAGEGRGGAAWMEEAVDRGITAVEIHGCISHVNYHGPETAYLWKERFLPELHKLGYRKHPPSILQNTEAQQWVGLTVGDRFQESFDKAAFKYRLGLDPSKRMATLIGSWERDDEFAVMTQEDLREWSEMARVHDVSFVYSPHPVFLAHPESPGAQYEIPDDVAIMSYVPGSHRGRKTLLARVLDVVRASDFIIKQFAQGGVPFIEIAARVPVWQRRIEHSRCWIRSRETLTQEEVVSEAATQSQRIRELRQAIYYRTADELEGLFAGELGRKGTEEDWLAWEEELELRLDGHTAERIVDLLET